MIQLNLTVHETETLVTVLENTVADLSYEIAGTKNRISVERKRYNDLVGTLNTRLRQVPWSLVAWNIDAREFYAAPSDQLVEPEITF